MAERPDPKFMQAAIDLSREGAIVKKTGGVFGAVVVDTKTGKIVGQAHNRVVADYDPTAHAEVLALRNACGNLKQTHLDGCVLYTSAEPCPMCYAASLWAHIDKVYYAATYDDAKKYGEFEDADFMKEMTQPAESKTMKLEPFMREEAVEVWKEYSVMPGRVHY